MSEINALSRKKLKTFFIILLLLMIPVTLVCYLTRGTTLWTTLLGLIYMPMPAVAAIITQKLIYKEPLKDLGLQLKGLNLKYFFLYPVLTGIAMLVSILLFQFIGGNLLHIPGFGTLTTDSMQLLTNLAGGQPLPANTSLPPFPVLLLITLGSSIIAGFTINGLFALGEELGWRGFLMNNFKQLGFLKSTLIIGLIWGFWHAPIILMGYNYPDNPLLGVFAMNLLTVPFAFVLVIARIKSRSVITSAIVHGMFNGYAGLTIVLQTGANRFVGTGLGILGFVLLSLFALLLARLYRKDIAVWYQSP